MMFFFKSGLSLGLYVDDMVYIYIYNVHDKIHVCIYAVFVYVCIKFYDWQWLVNQQD